MQIQRSANAVLANNRRRRRPLLVGMVVSLIIACTTYITIFRVPSPPSLLSASPSNSQERLGRHLTFEPPRHSTSSNSSNIHPSSSVVQRAMVLDQQSTAPPSQPRVNGVILFLSGGRWDSYFHKECLPRLEAYFLRCHAREYPVRIFHEDMATAQQEAIRAIIPSARSTDFENVAYVWKTLPHGIREESLAQWMQAGTQRKFQGRGYRIMCRFWAGLVWRLPSMQSYDYYWRLDTDSILTGLPRVDPLQVMQQRGCDYGFNRLKGENPHVAVGLWDAFVAWAREEAVTYAENTTSPSNYKKMPRWFSRVENFAVDPQTRQFWAPMYYNNFELGSMRLKRHPLYNRWFDYVDGREPFGILRHRWGDAPLHTLGVMVVLAAEGWTACNFTKSDVGYRHAAMKPGPMVAQECRSS
jgi:hypothetical protein